MIFKVVLIKHDHCAVLRKMLGLTQKDIATLVGTTKMSISNFERFGTGSEPLRRVIGYVMFNLLKDLTLSDEVKDYIADEFFYTKEKELGV